MQTLTLLKCVLLTRFYNIFEIKIFRLVKSMEGTHLYFSYSELYGTMFTHQLESENHLLNQKRCQYDK